jgi:DNA-binding response OmpR family regulator
VLTPKSVLCVSWIPSLASTREMLLTEAGYLVISALGKEEAVLKSDGKADLLVLGHSLPREDKQELIQWFREQSKSPILSLLKPGQDKLSGADVGVEAFKPGDFVRAVQTILAANR